MLVLDASAAIRAVLGAAADTALLARLEEDPEIHAPHLLDIEVLHALRGLVARGELSADAARDAQRDAASLLTARYPHLALADRIWALRDNLSAYDATYVALAEALDVPLITCDTRLAGAPGHAARIELFDARA